VRPRGDAHAGQPGPLPIRSTGASVAIAGHGPTIAALQAADFVLDCTVEGLLHSPELGAILGAGTRVLMISNEHPETFERMHHDPGLAERVARGKAMMQAATTMRVTSRAGTDLTVRARRGVLRRFRRLHRRTR
jgi:2,5-dihydroxypyridine 5,6-dioxygenase